MGVFHEHGHFSASCTLDQSCVSNFLFDDLLDYSDLTLQEIEEFQVEGDGSGDKIYQEVICRDFGRFYCRSGLYGLHDIESENYFHFRVLQDYHCSCIFLGAHLDDYLRALSDIQSTLR